MLDSVLRGKNGTVMAHGATSSGKTHTLFGGRMRQTSSSSRHTGSFDRHDGIGGGDGDGEDGDGSVHACGSFGSMESTSSGDEPAAAKYGPGVVEHCLAYILDAVRHRERTSGKTGSNKVYLAVYEVYNDQLHNLLYSADRTVSLGDLMSGKASATSKREVGPSRVRLDGTQGAAVRLGVGSKSSLDPSRGVHSHSKAAQAVSTTARQDPSQLPHCLLTDLANAMFQISGAVKRRAQAATACNDGSSRSHCIIRLALCAPREAASSSPDTIGALVSGSELSVTSVLNICDLAGSERTRDSRVVGASLSEACHVNTSLAALSDCIAALIKGGTGSGSGKGVHALHVPFRNSLLTKVLEPTLSGQSRSLVIFNMSNAPSHRDQTISTLRYVMCMLLL